MANISATPMQNFVRLSVAMTGIAQSVLAPDVDPFNMKQLYFDTANAKDGPTFQQLLGIVAANPTLTGDALANLILNQSGEAVGFLGRAILLMWYFGAWYDPTALQTAAQQAAKGQNPAPGTFPYTVLTADAYTQGWIWSVAQAHPMGYSNLRFGYWNSPPPPLSAFTGQGTTP